MHVTDTELGLAFGFGRAVRSLERDATAIIDARNIELAAAYRKIAALERELKTLRRDRAASNLALLESLKH